MFVKANKINALNDLLQNVNSNFVDISKSQLCTVKIPQNPCQF